MKKTKHTRGPWNVSRSAMGELEPFDSKGRHLLSSAAARPLPLKQREANGRLIEAAPPMRTALEKVTRRVTSFDRACKRAERTDIDAVWALLYDLRDLARDALKKTEE